MTCCERELQKIRELEQQEFELALRVVELEIKIKTLQDAIEAVLTPLFTAGKAVADKAKQLQDQIKALKDSLELLKYLLAQAGNFGALAALFRLILQAEALIALLTAKLAALALGAGIITGAAAVALLALLAEQAYLQSQLTDVRNRLVLVRYQLYLERIRLVECRRFCDDTRPPDPPRVEYDLVPFGFSALGAATAIDDLCCRFAIMSTYFAQHIGGSGLIGGPVPSRSYLLIGQASIDPIGEFPDDLRLSSTIRGVNASGVAAGHYWRRDLDVPSRREDEQAFLYDTTRGRRNLAVDGTPVAEVYGIRDDGVICGRIRGNALPVLIENSRIIEVLPEVLGTTLHMNTSGEIIGQGWYRAPDGSLTQIPRLRRADALYALAIGPTGHVVGYCTEPGTIGERAFRWSIAEGLREIPGLGGVSTRALGVSSTGQVVGWASLPDAKDGLVNAILWDPETNKTTDLNLRIEERAVFRLLSAACIDDTGRIGGFCFRGGGYGQGYILLPLRVDWGAKVTVTRTDGTVGDDYLVSFEPEQGRVVLQSGVDITRGSASVRSSVPLADIASITLADPRDGFNLYLVVPEGRSRLLRVRTCEFIGYAGGQVRYALRTARGGKVSRRESTGPVRSMFAILRKTGENREPAEQAQRFGGGGSVPPQLLAAIAYQESHGDGESWRQFAPTHRGSCRRATLINAEGAIGMMQLTNAAALFLSNFNWYGDPTRLPDNTIEHLYRISADPDANVMAGSVYLRHLLRSPPANVRARRPAWFVPGYGTIEHWYHATIRYNGDLTYARRVWNVMATVPYQVPIPAVEATIPAFEPPETTFPAHIDRQGRGVIQTVLSRPQIDVREGRVFLQVRPQALEGVVISVEAGLVLSAGYSEPVPLSEEDGAWIGSFSVDVPASVIVGEGLDVRVTVRAENLLVYLDVLCGQPIDPDIQVA